MPRSLITVLKNYWQADAVHCRGFEKPCWGYDAPDVMDRRLRRRDRSNATDHLERCVCAESSALGRQTPDGRCMPTRKPSKADLAWKAVQAALEAARQLPAGAEGSAALKKAGKLRFDADMKTSASAKSSIRSID
jgi:hypothetical protein